MIDVSEIEKRVDRAIAAPIAVNADVGGLSLETLGQVMEFAKLMAVSGAAVPKYLRGNPGACLAITSRALRSGLDPFALAEKSYMVMNRGEERIAFEAQAVHAMIIARAPLKGRLRHEITGEGDERRCKVSGTFRNEDKPHEYISETLGKKREARGRNEQGVLKGSPLWDTDPEVQLAYSAVRQWCRLHSPDTLLGVYTPDELDNEPIDVTPQISGLAQRLKDAKKSQTGFSAAHVASTAGSIIEGDKEVRREDAEGSASGHSVEADGGGDVGAGADLHPDGRETSDRGDPQRDEQSAAEDAASAQAEIFPPDRKSKPKSKRR